MKKMLLIASLGLLLISSCNKGKADFTIKGTIEDATFSAPLSNASVKLFATEAGSSSTDQIASATLDAQGNFEFVVPRDKVETYYLEITKDNYFEIYESIPFADLSVENDNVYNLSTTAKGWVK
ncbi:MAG: carboxypeptidase-like regulatory domain-containing protein, partial [Crocinitomicaceae bacterium]